MKELKIVVADDSKVISDAVVRALSRVAGLKVIGVAEDGVRALELVRDSAPHLLILDISMPLKNGIEVLTELRAENSAVIVIVFTADSSAATKRACRELEADYFLNKSQIVELIEICKLHLPAL